MVSKATWAAAIVLVRNEELWIRKVLAAATAVFEHVIVGDTGSTDGTAEIAAAVPGVQLIQFGMLAPRELGLARGTLGREAARLGADWAFQIDGDELYHPAALRAIVEAGMPEGKRAGFTTLISVDEADGGYWLLDDRFNRLAVFPAACPWYGEYPFEAPAVWGDEAGYHYFPLPNGHRFHGLHLHRLRRSLKDGDVYLRKQKQFQFCLQDKQVPRLEPFDLAVWEMIP